MRSSHNNYHNKHDGTPGVFLFTLFCIMLTIILLSIFLYKKTNDCKAKDITIKAQDSIISSLKNLPPKIEKVHDTVYFEPPKPEKKAFKVKIDTSTAVIKAPVDTIPK